MGCCSLLQRIFPTQESNLGPLHCRWILYHLSHQGSPYVIFKIYFLNMFQVYKALLLITVSTLYLGSSEWINLIAGSFYPSTKISPFPQSPASGNYFFFFPQSGFLMILFTSYFWLCWVFFAARLSLAAAGRSDSVVAVHGLLIVVASLVGEHGLSVRALQYLQHVAQ